MAVAPLNGGPIVLFIERRSTALRYNSQVPPPPLMSCLFPCTGDLPSLRHGCAHGHHHLMLVQTLALHTTPLAGAVLAAPSLLPANLSSCCHRLRYHNWVCIALMRRSESRAKNETSKGRAANGTAQKLEQSKGAHSAVFTAGLQARRAQVVTPASFGLNGSMSRCAFLAQHSLQTHSHGRTATIRIRAYLAGSGLIRLGLLLIRVLLVCGQHKAEVLERGMELDAASSGLAACAEGRTGLLLLLLLLLLVRHLQCTSKTW